MTKQRAAPPEVGAYLPPEPQPARGRRATPLPMRVAWGIVILLVVVGTAAGIVRGVFISGTMRGAEPVRARIFAAQGRQDPFAHGRPAMIEEMEGKFARHPVATRLHVFGGSLFLVFGALQLSSTIRRRYRAFHRWSGRILVVTAIASTVPAIYFGIAHPFSGIHETIPITLFSALFLFAILRAFVAIRARDVARHRVWMIRAFAVAIAISTVRLIAAPLDILLTPHGVSPQTMFVISIWSGWILTIAAAEIWLRRTRGAALPELGAEAR